MPTQRKTAGQLRSATKPVPETSQFDYTLRFVRPILTARLGGAGMIRKGYFPNALVPTVAAPAGLTA